MLMTIKFTIVLMAIDIGKTLSKISMMAFSIKFEYFPPATPYFNSSRNV